jgi:hypothetical protein
MSMGAAVGLGVAVGLIVGIAGSLTTDVPFAPEVGLALGALAGWLWRGYTEER